MMLHRKTAKLPCLLLVVASPLDGFSSTVHTVSTQELSEHSRVAKASRVKSLSLSGASPCNAWYTSERSAAAAAGLRLLICLWKCHFVVCLEAAADTACSASAGCTVLLSTASSRSRSTSIAAIGVVTQTAAGTSLSVQLFIVLWQ